MLVNLLLLWLQLVDRQGSILDSKGEQSVCLAAATTFVAFHSHDCFIFPFLMFYFLTHAQMEQTRQLRLKSPHAQKHWGEILGR